MMKNDEVNILIVDDENSIVESIKDYFDGYRLKAFTDSQTALNELQNNHYGIIIVDYKMPKLNGIELLIEAKKNNSYDYGIMLTAYADKNMLEEALNKNLVSLFIEKPVGLKLLKEYIDKAAAECKNKNNHEARLKKLEIRNKELSRQLFHYPGNIIGLDTGLKKVFSQVKKVAKHPVNVLITGETGTGKELIAHLIHELSPRKEELFVTINCAAIPEHLLESELFGYEKGAFTDASQTKPGRIELADKGTLFLDEIGEMSMKTQVKLLRVLQTREFERLGSNKTINVDFRLIAATNKDIGKAIRKKEFRKDLFYRVSEFAIHLPALRERLEDLEELLNYFFAKSCQEIHVPMPRIDPAVYKRLREYEWGGNIRELESMVKGVIITTSGKKTIECEDFVFPDISLPDNNGHYKNAINTLVSVILKQKKKLKEIVNDILTRLVLLCNNSVTRASKKSGIPRTRFYRYKQENR